MSTLAKVLAATCKLLGVITDNCHHLSDAFSTPPSTQSSHNSLMEALLASLNLFDLIRSMLNNSTSDRDRLAALEVAWTVANSRTANAEAFLRESGVVG